MVKKILFITLSNIGDVILTLPVLDILRKNYPNSQITVVTGPRAKEIFTANPYINNLIIYDKYAPLRKKAALFFKLKKEHFEVVIDLRNTLFGALLPAQFKTSPFLYVPSCIRHMKARNLYRLSRALRIRQLPDDRIIDKSLFISSQDMEYVNKLLDENSIKPNDKIIVIAPCARGANRRWPKEKFASLASELSNDYKVILVGANSDKPVIQEIRNSSKGNVFDFAGRTRLSQLSYLLKKACLVVVCDTGIAHLASYLDVCVVVIMGAGNERKYGPWSETSAMVKRDIFCRPCEAAQCRFGNLKCTQLIKVDDVLRQVKKVLITNYACLPACPRPASRRSRGQGRDYEYKRILIVRTDRIGDVLLSTPVITALRKAYPDAYLVMMVSPYAKEIVDGNPYLDEVIVYDKDGKHRSWQRTWRFALNLKKKKFDLALVLHPTNRVHLVTFIAGIRRRIGYDRKLGFLLTDRLEHTKHLGEKHELEYALDLLRYLGIEPEDKNLLMPVKEELQEWVNRILEEKGVSAKDRLVAIHPGASCISKIWPLDRFAQLADRLIEKYGFKILILAGPKDTSKAEAVLKGMHHDALNLAGKTSVGQLAGILKRCRLFISNDSGPVHIASGVGTPVISIFGRSQKGLSPLRWGPVGKNDRVAHKSVGCVECLAHNCVRDFVCLKAVSVEYVLNIADSILNLPRDTSRGGR